MSFLVSEITLFLETLQLAASVFCTAPILHLEICGSATTQWISLTFLYQMSKVRRRTVDTLFSSLANHRLPTDFPSERQRKSQHGRQNRTRQARHTPCVADENSVCSSSGIDVVYSMEKRPAAFREETRSAIRSLDMRLDAATSADSLAAPLAAPYCHHALPVTRSVTTNRSLMAGPRTINVTVSQCAVTEWIML